MAWGIQCPFKVFHVNFLLRENQLIGKDDWKTIDKYPHCSRFFDYKKFDRKYRNDSFTIINKNLIFSLNSTKLFEVSLESQTSLLAIRNNQVMLKKITNIPVRFYQLALLNFGLIIALSKEMSLFSIITSLLFVGVAVAPFGVILGLLPPPPHQIIHELILNKVKQFHRGLIGYVSQWDSLKQSQKQKTIIYILLGIYISTNFICPCVQTFLIVNSIFAFFFMQEEVELISGMASSLWQGKCPVPQ